MRINVYARFFLMTFLLCSLSAMAQDSPAVNVTGGGTADYIPRWTGAHSLGSSNIFETVGGNVGIGDTTPGAKLDVKGSFAIHGTAFGIANTGHVNFVAGQTFPGYAQLSASNTFGPDQNFNSNISVAGLVSAGSDLDAGGNVNANGNVASGGSVVSGAELYAPTEQLACNNCFPLVAANNGTQQIIQTTNNDTPGKGVFEIASFDANNKAVFYVDSLGDTTAAGSKSAVVPLKNGSMVEVFSMESPQVWFEDFGSAGLVGGVATVELESKFVQTVNTTLAYRVFLTPTGDCHGLYVAQKSPTSFEVRELGGGETSVAFDYRIVALRAGYESTRMPAAKLPVAAQLSEPPTASRPASSKR